MLLYLLSVYGVLTKCKPYLFHKRLYNAFPYMPKKSGGIPLWDTTTACRKSPAKAGLFCVNMVK
jgi:hypothetical protein